MNIKEDATQKNSGKVAASNSSSFPSSIYKSLQEAAKSDNVGLVAKNLENLFSDLRKKVNNNSTGASIFLSKAIEAIKKQKN
jgi:hypothetical protein